MIKKSFYALIMIFASACFSAQAAFELNRDMLRKVKKIYFFDADLRVDNAKDMDKRSIANIMGCAATFADTNEMLIATRTDKEETSRLVPPTSSTTFNAYTRSMSSGAIQNMPEAEEVFNALLESYFHNHPPRSTMKSFEVTIKGDVPAEDYASLLDKCTFIQLI